MHREQRLAELHPGVALLGIIPQLPELGGRPAKRRASCCGQPSSVATIYAAVKQSPAPVVSRTWVATILWLLHHDKIRAAGGRSWTMQCSAARLKYLYCRKGWLVHGRSAPVIKRAAARTTLYQHRAGTLGLHTANCSCHLAILFCRQPWRVLFGFQLAEAHDGKGMYPSAVNLHLYGSQLIIAWAWHAHVCTYHPQAPYAWSRVHCQIADVTPLLPTPAYAKRQA